MKAELEHEFWWRIAGAPEDATRKFPRDVVAEMVAEGKIASPKQAWATLVKWSDRGLYNYGVTLDLGWLEPGAVFPRQREVDAKTRAGAAA